MRGDNPHLSQTYEDTQGQRLAGHTLRTQMNDIAPRYWKNLPVHGILFDLDGTLLDTAADMHLALDRAFVDAGAKGPGLSDVRSMIGRGAPMLIERACQAQGLDWSAPQKAQLLQGFLDHYGALHDRQETVAQPYAGVADGLKVLHAEGLKLAVVTNKHHRFACALLEHLELDAYIDLVVGGDTCERRKPDPQPLQWACSKLNLSSDQVVMVGDSTNDVQAARAAAMRVICVPYGYNEGQDPRKLAVDALVESIAHLPGLLRDPHEHAHR